MSWLIDQLAKEWAVIKQAPLSFVIILILSLTLAFLFMKYLFGESLRNKNELIASLRGKLELYLPVSQSKGGKTETEELDNLEAVKPELLDPDLRLVNQHFANVQKWNARYCLAGKDFGGTTYTAACLDF